MENPINSDAETEALIAQMVANDLDYFNEDPDPWIRPIGASYHDYEDPVTSYEREVANANPGDDEGGWGAPDASSFQSEGDDCQHNQPWDPEHEALAFEEVTGDDDQYVSQACQKLQINSVASEPPINLTNVSEESLGMSDPDEGDAAPRALTREGKGKDKAQIEDLRNDNSEYSEDHNSETADAESGKKTLDPENTNSDTYVPGGINGVWRGRGGNRGRSRSKTGTRRGRADWASNSEQTCPDEVEYDEHYDEISGIMHVTMPWPGMMSKAQRERQRREDSEVVEIRLEDDEDISAEMDLLNLARSDAGKRVVC